MRFSTTELRAWFSQPRNMLLAAAGALLAGVVLFVLPVIGAGSPGFFASYHSLGTAYENLETSAHEGIACSSCHVDPRGRTVAALSLAADFYTNILRAEKSPRFVRFDAPSRSACLSCHGTGWSNDLKRTSTIPHPAHLRIASEKRDCVKCHKWTAHQEAYMQKHKKMPFSGVCVAYGCHVGTKTAEECFDCHHVLSDQAKQWKTEHPAVVQRTGANSCMETCHETTQCQTCHTTGKTQATEGLVTRTGLNQLEKAHIAGDWMTSHGAQALKGKAVCMECHVSDGECRACHTQRPKSHGRVTTWIGTHSKQAKTEDEPRCLTCHEKPFCVDCHKQFKEMS